MFPGCVLGSSTVWTLPLSIHHLCNLMVQYRYFKRGKRELNGTVCIPLIVALRLLVAEPGKKGTDDLRVCILSF